MKELVCFLGGAAFALALVFFIHGDQAFGLLMLLGVVFADHLRRQGRASE